MHLDSAHRFTLTEDAPLSWDAFSRFITTLQALRGADLLRVKGVLNIEGCRGPGGGASDAAPRAAAGRAAGLAG